MKMQNKNDRLGSAGPSGIFLHICTILLALAGGLAFQTAGFNGSAAAATPDIARGDTGLIKDLNIGVSRKGSTKRPRNVGDQAIVDGWPLYRTNRGQEAFNDAMATLKATKGPAPSRALFKGCANLECKIILPNIDKDGWLPAGRIWVSSNQYVLIVKSPRRRGKKKYRRNSTGRMKYFIFHEFQNSTFNTDPFDTISAHKFSVYVPFYMGKQMTDIQGNRFVVVVQVAPYDVRSIHASNKNSAGPGLEVAKNTAGKMQPLQGAAGILIATMVKNRAPRLKVVNHRGAEGRPMLRAYKRRLGVLRRRSNLANVRLPFFPAKADRVANVKIGKLADLIKRRGLVPSANLVASSSRVPPRTPALRSSDRPSTTPVAVPNPARTMARTTAEIRAPVSAPARAEITTAGYKMSPVAAYLKTNLAEMLQVPYFNKVIPATVTTVLEDYHEPGVVYLLDGSHNVLGKIHAHRKNGEQVKDGYVYTQLGNAPAEVANHKTVFNLKIDDAKFDLVAALITAPGADDEPKLISPPTRVTRPVSPPEPMLIMLPKRLNSSL